MAFADDIASLVKAVKVIEEDLKNAVSATENFQTNAAALANDLDTLPTAGRNAVLGALALRRSDHAAIKARALALLTPILVQIGRTINSSHVEGDGISDWDGFFRDFNTYLDDTADQKVTARAVTYASDPASGAAGEFRRLTVDYRGQKIESGKHNETVTAQVTGSVATGLAAHTAEVTIYGQDEGVDALDYQTGSGRSSAVTITQASAEKPTGLITNPNFTGNTDTTDNAAVTAATGWTLSDVAGSPTVLIEKTAGKIWRSNSFAISFSGASTTKKFTQDMPAGVGGADPYTPVLCGFAVYLNSGWTGTVTVAWGGKSQSFTESDFTAGAWKWVNVDLDADLFAYNWDTDTPQWTLTVATGAGAGSNELVIGNFEAQRGTRYQGAWYFYFANEGDAKLSHSVTWADSCSFAGIIQDILAFAFEGITDDCYLMTSGTTLISDPA